MKIQFIIAGWYYNQDSLINGLIELKKSNKEVSVFYACHKEPTQIIKDNFEWKLFPNVGLSEGAYAQATDYLNIEDDTICFWVHDDIIIKDWSFVPRCASALTDHGYKVIGNCCNYPTHFDPDEIREFGPTPEWDNKSLREYIKEKNRHIFDKKRYLGHCIRSSFSSFQFKSLKEVGGWEYMDYEPLINEEGIPHFRKELGIGGLGNLPLVMMSYKYNKIFGKEKIAFLSSDYLDSPFIYECARGEIDPNNPMKD